MEDRGFGHGCIIAQFYPQAHACTHVLNMLCFVYMKTPLRIACELQDTTPSTLGRKLKINGSLMRRYSLGEHVPSPKRRERIAKHLGVPVEQLWKTNE